jgi:hypothetical protein
LIFFVWVEQPSLNNTNECADKEKKYLALFIQIEFFAPSMLSHLIYVKHLLHLCKYQQQQHKAVVYVKYIVKIQTLTRTHGP